MSPDIKHLKALQYKQTQKTNKMLSSAEETDNPPEAQQVRSSSRERRPTEKGLELHEQEAKKNEKAFSKAYDSWKKTAKEIRTRLKT